MSAAEASGANEAHARYCTKCSEYKSIRGVWYLVRASPEADSEFYCESCFSFRRQGEPAPSAPEPVADLASELLARNPTTSTFDRRIGF